MRFKEGKKIGGEAANNGTKADPDNLALRVNAGCAGGRGNYIEMSRDIMVTPLFVNATIGCHCMRYCTAVPHRRCPQLKRCKCKMLWP